MRKIPEHGTPQSYKWELRNDGKACEECTSAWTEFHRYYRKNHSKVSKLRSRAYEVSMKEAGYTIAREPLRHEEAVSVEETA